MLVIWIKRPYECWAIGVAPLCI